MKNTSRIRISNRLTTLVSVFRYGGLCGLGCVVFVPVPDQARVHPPVRARQPCYAFLLAPCFPLHNGRWHVSGALSCPPATRKARSPYSRGKRICAWRETQNVYLKWYCGQASPARPRPPPEASPARPRPPPAPGTAVPALPARSRCIHHNVVTTSLSNQDVLACYNIGAVLKQERCFGSLQQWSLVSKRRRTNLDLSQNIFILI